MLLSCRLAQKTQPSRQRPEHLGDSWITPLLPDRHFRVGYLSAANDFEGFNSPGLAARFDSNHQVGTISATGGAASSSFLGLSAGGSVTFEPLKTVCHWLGGRPGVPPLRLLCTCSPAPPAVSRPPLHPQRKSSRMNERALFFSSHVPKCTHNGTIPVYTCTGYYPRN